MRQRWVAGLLAIATACAPGVAPAQERRVDAVDLFALAGQAAEGGRTDEALQLYDALSQDPDVEVRSEARFRKGQLLAGLHRYREAAQVYRRLLDDKPQAGRVRIELAAMLAQIGDEPGARRQLRLAQAGGLPPEVAEQVSQFSRALRSAKRVGGSLEATLAPDTNINRGTQARTLDTVIAPLLLSGDARETSGIGLRLRGSGFAKQPLTDRLSLTARTSGSADLYRGGRTNDVLASALLGGEWRGSRDQLSAAYGFTRRWYGGEAFADSRTITGEWLHQVDRVTQLSTNISRGTIRYRRNPLQDGTLYDGNVSVEHALSARAGIAIGIGVTRQDAIDPSYASTAFGPLVYGWREMGRMTLFASATMRRLIGDERNFLFIDKRRERFLSARGGVILRQWAVRGFAPTLRVGYERNQSTVAIFDYRRAYGEFGLTRSF